MTRLAIHRREYARPMPPRVSAITQPFWQGLEQGRFCTTRCQACGKLSFPPKDFCPHCWSEQVAWEDLPPGGRIYSHTTVHIVPRRFRIEAPYSLALVDLDAGLRLMLPLLEPLPDDGPSAIGRRISLVVLQYSDGPLFGASLEAAA
ncbi:OB-fold domain-containing protein [Ferrovibrio sp. MS7]|jgi:uncharacterized OB-fold protein|uniref:Zn-ribbon domain-containing OB-fold protein n=1 Tax=Ferrovibrio plantarum TaxID=3119164 RepID=UPI003136D401